MESVGVPEEGAWWLNSDYYDNSLDVDSYELDTNLDVEGTPVSGTTISVGTTDPENVFDGSESTAASFYNENDYVGKEFASTYVYMIRYYLTHDNMTGAPCNIEVKKSGSWINMRTLSDYKIRARGLVVVDDNIEGVRFRATINDYTRYPRLLNIVTTKRDDFNYNFTQYSGNASVNNTCLVKNVTNFPDGVTRKVIELYSYATSGSNGSKSNCSSQLIIENDDTTKNRQLAIQIQLGSGLLRTTGSISFGGGQSISYSLLYSSGTKIFNIFTAVNGNNIDVYSDGWKVFSVDKNDFSITVNSSCTEFDGASSGNSAYTRITDIKLQK